MKQSHHVIDYIEFPILDMNQAKTFYAAAFGWEFNDYGPEYSGIKNESGDGEIGGFRLEKSIHQGGPLVVLYSKSLEGSLEQVKGAGGVISKEIFAFPGGKRFQFKDPSGNELAVWSDKNL